MAKKIEVAGHFVTDRVNVVGPCECVSDGDSQELEGANLFNLTAIDTYLQSAASNLPTRVDEHALCF